MLYLTIIHYGRIVYTYRPKTWFVNCNEAIATTLPGLTLQTSLVT